MFIIESMLSPLRYLNVSEFLRLMFCFFMQKVLYEISSTVCIHVSSKELNDFGVMKRDETELQRSKSGRKVGGRRKKMQFLVEETSENHVVCAKRKTLFRKLKCNKASDTFLMNGGNLSMYLQKFKQKARTVQDPKVKQFSSIKELMQFYQELNSKWILKWDDKGFTYSARDTLCESITPEIYQEYVANRSQHLDGEKKELDDEKLKSQSAAILKERNDEIRQEFFNFYIQSHEMKQQHEKLQKIVKDLDDDINDNLLSELPYIEMKYKRTSLSGFDYNVKWWKDKIVKEMVDGTNKLLKTFKDRIDTTNYECRQSLRKAAELKKPKKRGAIASVVGGLKDAVVGENVEEAKLREMSQEEFDKYKEKLKDDAKYLKKSRIKSARNEILQFWCNTFVEQLDQYKYRVYKSKKNGSIIHPKSVKDALKKDIEDKYAKLRLKLREKLYHDFQSRQKEKKLMKTATLKKVIYKKN